MASTVLSTLALRSPSSYPAHPVTKPSLLHFPLSRRRTTRSIVGATSGEPHKIEKLSEEITTLTLEEAKNLVDYLQGKLGIPAMSAPIVDAGDAATAAVEEKTEFDVVTEDMLSNEETME